ncbi:MAG: type II toxin-antitoxin system Phd/YefM family antitoxin [Deltaproteobacteria bacterium]|nr:type II toxin-antitoxin system Phd/YefM family antitoxin [Deltaproteobacteria bacterium]
MKTVTVHEAKTTLSKLLAATEQGEEFVLCRGETPVARLIPIGPRARPRPKVGEVTSQPVSYSEDCFLPAGEDEEADWGLR